MTIKSEKTFKILGLKITKYRVVGFHGQRWTRLFINGLQIS